MFVRLSVMAASVSRLLTYALLIFSALAVGAAPPSGAHPTSKWWWSQTFAELHLRVDPPSGFDTWQPVLVECLGRAPQYDPEGLGLPLTDRRMEYGPGTSSRLGRERELKFRHLRCLVVQHFAGREVIRAVNRWGVYDLHVTGPGYPTLDDPGDGRPEAPRPFVLVRLR